MAKRKNKSPKPTGPTIRHVVLATRRDELSGLMIKPIAIFPTERAAENYIVERMLAGESHTTFTIHETYDRDR